MFVFFCYSGKVLVQGTDSTKMSFEVLAYERTFGGQQFSSIARSIPLMIYVKMSKKFSEQLT